MSEDGKREISNSISREVFHFSSVVERLTREWPSQQAFITQQVQQYIDDVRQMAQNLNYTGTIIQPYDLDPDLESDSLLSQNDSLFLVHDDSFFESMTMHVDNEKYDNSGGNAGPAGTGSQYLAHSAHLDVEVSPPAGQTTCPQETIALSNASNIVPSTDIEYVTTTTTINPAILSLRAKTCADVTNRDMSTQLIPAPSTAPHQREHNAETADTESCSRLSNKGVAICKKTLTKRRTRADSSSSTWIGAHLTVSISQELGKIGKDRQTKIETWYRSIGNAESLILLKRILSAVKSPHMWTLKCDNNDVRRIFQSLECLDATTQACGLNRRVFSVRLTDCHDRRSKDLSAERQSRKRPRMDPEPTVKGKVATEVLNMLVREIFPRPPTDEPDLFEHDKKRVKNRLYNARNWQRATKCIALGILALVPIGGTSKLQHNTYETLQDHECEVLLQLLKTKDGGYLQVASEKLTPLVQAMYNGDEFPARFKFEFVDDATLHTADPSRFVELCEQVEAFDIEPTDASR